LDKVSDKKERPATVKEHLSYESNVFVAEGEVQKKEEPNVQEALETLQKKLKKDHKK
jgi:hypothetical protein